MIGKKVSGFRRQKLLKTRFFFPYCVKKAENKGLHQSLHHVYVVEYCLFQIRAPPLNKKKGVLGVCFLDFFHEFLR